MKTSAPSVPNTLQTFAEPVHVVTARPTIAILPAQQSVYSPHDERLYGLLSTALIQLGRFNVLERDKIQGLVQERDLAKNGYAEPIKLGKLLSAQKLLIAEMTSDPTGRAVQNSTGKSYHYESYARASVRFVDVSTGVAYDAFEVSEEGSDPKSRELAQQRAMDSLVAGIVAGVRDRTRHSAVLTARQGRAVRLDHGSDVGIRPGQFFDEVDSFGQHWGQIQVNEVSSTYATGQIVRGYYSLDTGKPVIEQSGGGYPFGIGYANRSLVNTTTGQIDGTFNGLDLHFNQSGMGLGGGVELGVATQRGGVAGFEATARLEPQLELIPERFWLYATLGGALGLYGATIPGTTDTASDLSLHGLASVGANLSPLGGLNLFVDAGYLTPWQLNGWQRSAGDKSLPVTESMPTPTIGGTFARAGLGWAF